MRPADPVTVRGASRILGCSTSVVRRHILSRRLRSEDFRSHQELSRSDVEALAAEIYDWRAHLTDRYPYWVTGQRAATILGIGRSQLGHLAAAAQISFVRHGDGTRLYRRGQLEGTARLLDSSPSGDRPETVIALSTVTRSLQLTDDPHDVP